MSTLDRALRKTLADTIIKAREVAEEAARDAIRRLGVIEDEPPVYLSAEQKALRVRLRAHARSLGDEWNSDKKKLLSTWHLENEAAYEIWHRMLFGRFLVERGLLIHPDLGEPIAPSELADLAREEGEADPWAMVERFAAPSLPAVLKPDDPVLAMTLDPALSRRLRDLVSGLPVEVFLTDDALGWTYQFWRTSEKEAVNKAGGKVGSVEVPAVTQLFTERYMVQFLLHNTLGAWWAAKHLVKNPELARDATSEQELRDACALPGIAWEYLRFIRDGDSEPWRPAAGSFPGWPKTASAITYCDPCCGSGHFLVEAFLILAAMRQYEEGLSGSEVARAVLRENLHGLELDGRCVQIAAFNVALTAWKVAGAPVALPQPQIAWAGAPPPMSRSEMAALGGSDPALQRALEHLHNQFAQAPLLGTLLEIGARDLLDADLRDRGTEALAKLKQVEPERIEGAIAAQGLLDAAKLLGRQYILLATNVPFLGRGRQEPDLAKYIARNFPEAKADLATVMLRRMYGMLQAGGTIASVSPQNWLFLGSYKEFRDDLLRSASFSFLAGLGSRSFETITGEVVNVSLIIYCKDKPDKTTSFAAIDANEERDAASKAMCLLEAPLSQIAQSSQIGNPDHIISLQRVSGSSFLSSYADCFQGTSTGDNERTIRLFWEHLTLADWELFAGPPEQTSEFSGLTDTVHWKTVGSGKTGAAVRGDRAWGKTGIIFGQMASIPSAFYTGAKFANSSPVLIPRHEEHLPAIAAFVKSGEFLKALRTMNRKVSVDNGYITKVPFELDNWLMQAEAYFPEGLPKPISDNPTQWLFHGHPAYAEVGTELHVALVRIAGYRWPAELDTRIQLADVARERIADAGKLPGADTDGLLPLFATGGDRSLADRLRAHLAAAYGAPLTPSEEANLVREADVKLDRKEARDMSLEGWLQDRAFRQHCILFQHRPFLWQVWDGLRDGFSAFLHYHRLNHATLEKLTFSLLGDWIAKARVEDRTAHEEHARQLQQKLRAILDGETPYDTFVRWKPRSEQSLGWRPDLDDGVRLNIRPFMNTGVLREQPRINWNKDRGTDLPAAPWFHLGPAYGGKEGDRINDHHLTLAEKRAAQRGTKAS